MPPETEKKLPLQIREACSVGNDKLALRNELKRDMIVMSFRVPKVLDPDRLALRAE